MKSLNLSPLINVVSLWAFLVGADLGLAQGAAFTYQGWLTENGTAGHGRYDFRFALFDAASGGNRIGSLVVQSPVSLSNGLFTVALDFGSLAFNGSERWLEIGVRPYGSTGFYNLLTPRQPVLATPYAMHAASAAGLAGNPTVTGTVTFSPTSGPPFLVGSSARVASLNADLLDGLDSSAFAPVGHSHGALYWSLTGNSGTTAGANYLGTADDEPLELKVYRRRALRLEPTGSNAVNVIGGWIGNEVASGVVGATVGGGGAGDYAGQAFTNRVTVDFGAIGGGRGNSLGMGAADSIIGGGLGNSIQWGRYAVIGGGYSNSVRGNFPATCATIGGGQWNRIAGYIPPCSTIGGGLSNSTLGAYATVAGGQQNSIGDEGNDSTIGGGRNNNISMSVDGGTIAGGEDNFIGDLSFDCTIGGGTRNTNDHAAINSTVGGGSGNSIQAWGENSVIGGGARNTILARATYGTIPGGRDNSATNDAFAAGRRAKAVHPGAFVWADSTDADFASTAPNQFLIRAGGGVGVGTRTPVSALQVVGTVTATAFNPTSDRGAKQQFASVDCRAVLDKVVTLPIESWSFKEEQGTRHIGPMAQDFHSAFAVGTDDKHIATVDADGVALAAIQGLNQKLEAQIRAQEAEIRQLRQSLAELQTWVRRPADPAQGERQAPR